MRALSSGLDEVLLLLEVVGQDLLVLGLLLLGMLVPVLLDLLDQLLSSDSSVSHQSLDLRGLGDDLVAHSDVSLDDVLGHIVLLLQVEHLSDLASSLRTSSSGLLLVSQSRHVGVALLDHGQRDHSQVGSADASSDGLSLALAGSPLSVVLVTLLEEQSDSLVGQHALLHSETLLVVAACDLEHISLELVGKLSAVDFLTHAFVVEDSHSSLVVDLDLFLLAGRTVRDVELRGG